MKITFLGHAGFMIEGSSVTILVDPFISGNPQAIHTVEELSCDYIALTHGHADHIGDTAAIAKRNDAIVIAPFEVGALLEEEGVSAIEGGNPGGMIRTPFGFVAFTTAIHSSSYKGRYAGVACGLVIEVDGKRFYHAGDTDIFSDMELIGEVYGPDIAAVPIGDRFTMGAALASRAAEMIGAPRVIPIHYKTFPLLAQNADGFAPKGIEVVELQPGKSVTV